MATANFKVINAQSYYILNDTYEMENEEGVMEEVVRDDWEWDDLLRGIRYWGEETEMFPCTSDNWNKKMDARNICKSNTNWETFGNGNAWTTETNIESFIVVRDGHYSGAVLDYDIKVTTCEGDEFYLSEYDNMDDLMKDYLNAIRDIVDWKGHNHKWNSGTFKIQKENIRKWIMKRIANEVEKCEKFCKESCETELEVYARFSNGETWYTKVG